MSDSLSEEVLLDLPSPAASLPLATHVRGSVLAGSLRSLRLRQLEPAYFAALDPAFHQKIRGVVAAEWVPAAQAVAHYRACEQLALRPDVIDAIGAETGAFLNATYVQVLMRIAHEGGTTPISILARIERVRARLWHGSAFRVVRVGPKDLRIEWHGQPCASVPYFREGFGAFLAAVVRPFARSLYVRTLPRVSATVLAHSVSWV